jgi:cobalt-precorrin 5A hydrolase / precorrin-3B C17-methyltransferase
VRGLDLSRVPERSGIAVVAVTRGGAPLAAELAASLGPGVELHVAERWVAGLGPTAKPFAQPLAQHLAVLFPRVEGLVLVLALGATVRLLAPLLSSKQADPAVVVLDEAGRHAISVLGGHRAGANDLAERVALAVAAEPVVTTAADARGLPAVDLIGREHGWSLDAPPETVTRVSAAVVNGEPVAVYQDAGERTWATSTPAHWPRPADLEELARWPGPALVVTDRALEDRPTEQRDRWVIYRPPTLVLGVGCSTGVAAEEIARLARTALAEASLARECVALIATIDRRLDEPGLRRFAEEWKLPLRGFGAAELAALGDLPSPSDQVARHVGTPGVAEPAAVLGSGGGDLVLPKRKSTRATVAVARRVATGSGQQLGSLTLVGLGPGSLDLMTARARRALRAADVIVGYRGYVEPLRAALPGKSFEPYELGQEAERAEAAISLAGQGRQVALVSSGDAGIYGMAGPVFELLGEGQQPTVEVVPGVTAAGAAAALLGAPLMLDFAVISLSDLLVPWARIERRLRAAAAGDLVIVLYNPASSRRTVQLPRAARIILEHRSAETPVGIVRDAERPEQSVQLASLDDLDRAPVDMRTVVVVGNSATVRLGDRLVTRRGYATAEPTGGRPAESGGHG